MIELLTQDYVKYLFYYHEDGNLYWKNPPPSTVSRGTKAGFIVSNGYRRIKMGGKTYAAHRIVWLWHYGSFPKFGVDHINRKKIDNRIENLRDVGQTCNSRNCGNFITNTSGVKGISWDKRDKKWLSRITIKNKLKHLGRFKKFKNAVLARLTAEDSLGWSDSDSSSPAYKYAIEHGLIEV